MEDKKNILDKIYPRDIIALVALIAGFILMYLGINHVVSGIVIMIITYYFSKRIYEEKNPNGNIKKQVQELAEEIQQIPKPPKLNITTIPTPEIKKEPLTTGDFSPVPAPQL